MPPVIACRARDIRRAGFTRDIRRAGFTLAELLISLVLLTIVGTAVVGLIVRQQRFYVGTAEIIQTRGSVRQMADLLPTEMRSLSPQSGDIESMDIASIKFRSLRGASVICNLISGTQIVVPPVNLSRRNALTAWAAMPVPGDSVLVFDEQMRPRQWHRRRITNVGTGTCLAALNFGASAAENAAGILITLDETLPATMINGAPLRIYRQGSYELYQASGGDWYLGYRDCLPFRTPECDAIQPVSGPYMARADAATGGLVIRYLDLAGNVTNDPDDVARIEVVARAASRRPVRMFHGAGETYRDSIAFTISVRN